MRTATTTSSQWTKRVVAAGLLTLAPAFMALSLSPVSEADPGASSSITTNHSGPKTPSKAAIHNGGEKHHHHHRHFGHKKGSSDDSE